MTDLPPSRQPVLVTATRTPFGRSFKGALVPVRPDDLVVGAIRAAIDAAPGLSLDDIDELVVGCGDPRDEQGGNIARRAAAMLGADGLSGITVNRLCASSVDSVRIAASSILSGSAAIAVAAGVESISRYKGFNGQTVDAEDSYHPMFDEARTRTAQRARDGRAWSDPRREGLLPDIYIGMGQTAENVAQAHGVSRQDQDDYAALSQHRTERARQSGRLARQLAPVPLPDGGALDYDECPRPGTDQARLAGLPTPFRATGSVTAGNACGLADGASAAVVMSLETARRLGIAPRARIIASATAGVSPEVMGLGPVAATRRLLDRHQLGIEDFGAVELNEAFAAQVLASQRVLGIDIDRLNPQGGAIAVGHPFGATGIRLFQSLLDGLDEADADLGLLTLCVGGGQGVAVAVERMT